MPWENIPLERFILEAVAARYVNGFVLQPLHFMNEILSKGETEIGMGFQWKPFEIDRNEYQELVDILCTDPTLNASVENDLDHAKSLHDWQMKVGKKHRYKKNGS